MCLYIVISVCGYLTFGDLVPSNIINAYPHTPLVAALRAILGVVVLCNFPLQIFASRASTVSLLDACCPTPLLAPPPANHLATSGLFLNTSRDVRITIASLAVTGSAAFFVTDLGQVVSLVGSTGATVISLITPAAAYLMLVRPQNGETFCTLLRSGAVLMGLMGVTILPSKLFCA